MLCVAFSSSAFSQYDEYSRGEYWYMNTRTTYTSSAGWSSSATKRLDLKNGYEIQSDGRDHWNQYGSYEHLQVEATGYYRVEKIDGRWWLIDPEGFAGINRAVTSFSASDVQENYDVTKELGFCATGNFLTPESQTKDSYNASNVSQFAYTRRINFFQNYKNSRSNYHDMPSDVDGSTDHVAIVLSPEFADYCDSLASVNVAPYSEERDLLGYFTDNEINFNDDQLQNIVADAYEDDPARIATLEWAAENYGLSESDCENYTSAVTTDIKNEFAGYIAGVYYKAVNDALKKYDPNHLNLGSRLHGRARGEQRVVNASHAYCDVTSVNFYNNVSPRDQISLDAWTCDHPCIVGEFYIKDYDTYNVSQDGAGYYCIGQPNRGYWYQNCTMDFMESKCYIGWHYFRYMDDTDSNKGLVDPSGNLYTEMAVSVKEFNDEVYYYADFIDGIDRTPVEGNYSVTIPCVADSYVELGSTNTNTFGSAEELEVRYNRSESGRRSAFVRFDLSGYEGDRTKVKNAKLILNCTASDASEERYIAVGGLLDNEWDENAVSGSVVSASTTLAAYANRLDFERGVLPTGATEFDVTLWLKQETEADLISFKVFDTYEQNSTSFTFASKEHSDATLHPQLVITYYGESTGIQSATNNASLSYSVNDGMLTVAADGNQPCNCNIYNLQGELVLNTTVMPYGTIDLSAFSGLYILEMTSSSERSVAKIVL